MGNVYSALHPLHTITYERVGDIMFFGSDWHLSHANIIEYENRPFTSVEEMNEILINNVNERVGKNDPFYMLGDIAFDPNVDKLLERMNGKKYLIIGNHDQSILRNPEAREKFEWIKDYHLLKANKQKIFLCHYPMISWNCSFHGSYHFYGHVHSREMPYQAPSSYNVGMDVNGFYPITLEDAIAKAVKGKNPL